MNLNQSRLAFVWVGRSRRVQGVPLPDPLLKFVNLTSQLRHSLVLHPPLEKSWICPESIFHFSPVWSEVLYLVVLYLATFKKILFLCDIKYST